MCVLAIKLCVMIMACPLCPPVPGVKKLRYEDNMVWVAEIEGVECPVIALKRHNGVPTDAELGHLRMVLEDLGLWDPAKYVEGAKNPGHYHVYIRKPMKAAIRVKADRGEDDGVMTTDNHVHRDPGEFVPVDT